MSSVVIHPLPRAGIPARVMAWVRGISVPRLVNRLLGFDTVVLEGRVFAVRAQPIKVCRTMIPALLRCSKRFASFDFDESMSDDLVIVLSQGLSTKPAVIEQLSIPLWSLTPVIEKIAIANGLPLAEAGRSNPGEIMTALALIGTNSASLSSAQPAGPQPTSTTS